MAVIKKIPVLSWALYDLANQFFALIIVSLYFPRWLHIEKGAPEIFYSLSYGSSMLLVAVSAPFLGAFADDRGKHRGLLVVFTLLSVVFTMALSLPVGIFAVLVFFALANLGCQEAIVFYNALLADVAPEDRTGFVSGLGRVFGYSGAVLSIYLTKPFILNAGYRQTFFITGVMFLLFALPCMIMVKGPRAAGAVSSAPGENILGKAAARLRKSVLRMRGIPGFKNFLAASFFALCAVNTITLFMLVYAGRIFGLGEARLIDLIVFSTFFAIGGSALSGAVSDRLGHRRSMMWVLGLWGLSILCGSFLEARFVWLIGALVGLSLGSTWVVLRAMVVRLVPRDMMGEAFGLFNLISYLSGVAGPVFWGLILLYFDRFGDLGYRMAFLSLIAFIAAGMAFISREK